MTRLHATDAVPSRPTHEGVRSGSWPNVTASAAAIAPAAAYPETTPTSSARRIVGSSSHKAMPRANMAAFD